jgi:hypothetical protein
MDNSPKELDGKCAVVSLSLPSGKLRWGWFTRGSYGCFIEE